MVYRRSPAACERARQSKDEVLRAARTVVAAEGMAGLSMAAVAVEAGVAVGSLYRHFPSKTDLVTELVRTTCEHELAVLRAIATGTDEARRCGHEPDRGSERLAAAVSVFARRALSSGRVAYAMICEPTVAEAELLRRSIRAEMATILASIVADGVADGSFPAQDALLAGLALVGAVSEVLTAPNGYAIAGDHDQLVESIGAMALRSVGAARVTA